MQYYGQTLGGKPLDKVLHERYFQNINGKTAIECGACDGKLEVTCLSFERFLGWNCINIEPWPYLFKLLKENRPNSTNINAALSDKNGSATFTQAVHPGMGELFGNGSLTHTAEHKATLQRDHCTFKTEAVETMTYRTLMGSLNTTELELFVLDVEGHELDVIKGMHGAAVLPRILCVEHGHLGIAKLSKALAPLGFKFDISYAHNSFYIKNTK